jgi:hypothetical protein
MSPRLINDLLLIIISVFTFVFLKKTITTVATASSNYMEYNLINIIPDFGYSESDYENRIEWKKGLRLNMNDLRGNPPAETGLRSEGVISFTYSAEKRNDSLYVTVNNLFDEQSWINKKDFNKAVLLQHEQAHFDLNEVYARKFREKIVNCKFVPAAAEKQLQEIYLSVKEEALNKHVQFDKESMHSANISSQRNWRNQIQQDLNDLDTFSAKEVGVALK